MTTLRRILIATAGLAISSGLASADQLYTQTFVLPAGSTTTGWTQSALINQFDTSLGTLEWISFQVVANTTVSGAATDANANSNGNDTYTFNGTTNLTLGDGTNTLILAPATSVSKTFTGIGPGGVMTVSAAPGSQTSSVQYIVDTANALSTSCVSHPGVAGCDLNGTGQVDPIVFAAYLGTGTVSLSVDAQTNASFSGPPYIDASGSGTADATVTVDYDYIPGGIATPEPTAMILLGSALIGLGLARRSHRR